MNQQNPAAQSAMTLVPNTLIVPPIDDHMHFVIRPSDQYQSITIEPRCPELESLLQLRTITTTDDPSHGYRLQQRPEPLLGLDNQFANGGLALVAAYALRRMGHDVDRRLPIVPALSVPLATPTVISPLNPHVLNFIRQNSHGLIAHGLGINQLASLSIEMALAFPATSFAFVAPNKAAAESLFGKFGEFLGGVTLAYSDRCHNARCRVAVVTSHGLAHPDMVGDPFDVLVFLDAAAAVGSNGQMAIFANGRSRLFGMLHLDQDLAPRISDLIMAAFGPELVTVPELGCRCREVQVASIGIKGPKLPAELSGYRLHRQGIVHHPLRNRRIARLAKALVADDRNTVQQLCPAACQFKNVGAYRTLVLVADVEHGIELAKRLPGWPLVIGDDANLTGLSVAQRSIVNERGKLMVFDRAIVTVASMSTICSSGFDVVVWAAGGMGLPVPEVICEATDERPLLWIDVRDGHHGQLRRASRRRQVAYEAAGWFPVGTLPVIGRIKRFLAGRPEDEE